MYFDHAVEAVFHTQIHDTQMISFYLMWAVGAGIIFFMASKIVIGCKNLIYKGQIFFYRKKASFRYSWQEKSIMYKVGSIGGIVIACLTYVMFFI
jgi:hypothetical protein